MITSVPIIDSHVHLWLPESFCYSWLDGLPRLNRAFSTKDFRAASLAANVEKFIFVEGGTDPGQGLAEADWAAGLAASEPLLKGIVAQSTLVPDELERLALNPLVKGVRPNAMGKINADGLKLLPELRLSCDLCIIPAQLPTITSLAARNPEITFILDHCGKPFVLDHVLEPWSQDIKTLAGLGNVFCKISGLTTEADHWAWQPLHLQPYIGHVLEYFGFDRVLFGSDWPVATLATDYCRWIEAVQWAVGGANEIDLRKLFHDNAERIYRV